VLYAGFWQQLSVTNVMSVMEMWNFPALTNFNISRSLNIEAGSIAPQKTNFTAEPL
jgi:hypothetical protein